MTANKGAAPIFNRRSSMKTSRKQSLKDQECEPNKITDLKIENLGKIHKNTRRKSVKFAKSNLLEPATSKLTKIGRSEFASSQIAETSTSENPNNDQSVGSDAHDSDTPLRKFSSSRLKLINLQTAMGGEGPDADWFALSRYMDEQDLLREVIRRRARLKIMSKLRISELPMKDKEMFLSLTDTMKHDVSLTNQTRSNTGEWYPNTSSDPDPETSQVECSAGADKLKRSRLLLIKYDGTNEGAAHIEIIPSSLLLHHKLDPDFKPVYNPNLLELSKEPNCMQTSKNNLLKSRICSTMPNDFSALLHTSRAIPEGHKSVPEHETTYKRVIPTSSVNPNESNYARVTSCDKLQKSPDVSNCIYKTTPAFAGYLKPEANAKARTSTDTLKVTQLTANQDVLHVTATDGDGISGINKTKNLYGIKTTKSVGGIMNGNAEINLKQVAPKLMNSRSSPTGILINGDIINSSVISTDSATSTVETVSQTSSNDQTSFADYMKTKNQKNDADEIRDTGSFTLIEATANQAPLRNTSFTTALNHSMRKSNLTVDTENVKQLTVTMRRQTQ